MRLKPTVVALLLILVFASSAQAQEERTKITMKEAKLLVPRPQLNPVKSMNPNEANPIDTLETSTPGVGLILFDDNTWKLYRNPDDIMAGAVFTDNWNTTTPNPFKTKLEELPNEITLMLVDENGGFKSPDKKRVYSPFGIRRGRRHMGVDLPLVTGDPIYATFAGKVRMSKYYAGYGNLVVLRHENGLETFYGHLSKRNVDVGDWVEAGQVIGLGGNTGRSTGPHLHFEVRYQGFAFDPQWMIDFESGDLRSRLFVLKKKYLSTANKYTPSSDDEEIAIYLADTREKAIADSLVAVKKAEEERLAAELAAARYYKVKSGDTLSGIARKNGTTVTAICRLNPGLTAKTVLKIGRNLRVK